MQYWIFQIVSFKILDEFLNYRSQRRREAADDQSPWVHADNFHLLFGKGFDGATVGMATVGTMCGDRSGGVNQVNPICQFFHPIFVVRACLA